MVGAEVMPVPEHKPRQDPVPASEMATADTSRRHREVVSFFSDGLRCEGWLFRPPSDGPHPCVVMAHGFGGIRAARLDAFATRFAEAGIAALAFDYRHWGTSQGDPRGLIDIDRQRQDYRAAVAHARELEGIDPERIGLWGTSFSGGHVLTVAAHDPKVAAAVLTNPYVDGLAAVHKSRKSTGLMASLRLLRLAITDQVCAALGRPPRRVSLMGPPGSTAVFTTPDAEEGYESILPADHTGWEPTVPARVLLRIAADRPARAAHRITCPVMVGVCKRDRIAPVTPAIHVAEQAPQGELTRYPLEHFDVFTGEGFERVVADQTAFLQRTLVGGPPTFASRP